MAIEQVNVPDIGGAEDAEVIEVLVAVGDSVAIDQGLVVLESDKASMEIPSTAAGTVVEVLVAEGDQLAEGAGVIKVEVTGEAASSSAAQDSTEQDSTEQDSTEQDSTEQVPMDSAPDPATPANDAQSDADAGAPESDLASPAPTPGVSSTPSPANNAPAANDSAVDAAVEGVYAGPAVRKMARELGVALEQVSGSGPQGRVVKDDVQAFVQKALAAPPSASSGAGLPQSPEVDYSKFGEVEVVQRSKLDRLTADNMQRSWLTVPHVTQWDEADITELEAFRKELKAEAQSRDLKLSPLPFVLKACAMALVQNPKLNSSLARGGADLVYRNYVNIGMAVDTPAGLVVPVIRDVDKKGVWELAAEVMEMATRARDRKLTPAQMQGGCFSVSSLGSIGGNGFTPIVNTPEVAILGVSRAAVKPMWDGEAFVPRTLMPLSLSYDHRVVNGGDAGRFFTGLVALLADIRRLLL